MITVMAMRQFSVRSWAKCTWQAGIGVGDTPLGLAAFRQLSSDTMSKLSLKLARELVQLRCAGMHELIYMYVWMSCLAPATLFLFLFLRHTHGNGPKPRSMAHADRLGH
jgi:hypothetical protein